MVKIDRRQKGGNNMVIEIISWALKILIIIPIASVLCLAWYVWDRRNLLFRGIAFPESFIENPYILVPKKEGNAHLAFLEKVKACHRNYIEDYKTVKEERKRFIEYILFLPSIVVPDRTEGFSAAQLLTLAEALVAPGELTKEERPLALEFAAEIHPVSEMKDKPIACYRFRQHLTATEYAEASYSRGKAKRSKKAFAVFVIIQMAVIFGEVFLSTFTDAYVNYVSTFAEKIGCYLTLALLFSAILYSRCVNVKKVSLAEIIVMAFLYTACVILLNNLWRYMLSDIWLKDEQLYFKILLADLKNCAGMAALRYPLVLLASACGLFAEGEIFSREGQKEKAAEAEQVQHVDRIVEKMVSDWEDSFQFVFLFGASENRKGLIQKAEDIFRKREEGQCFHISADELPQLLQSENAIAEYSLLIIENVDDYLMIDPHNTDILFSIITEVAARNGKVILSSTLRPGDMEGLNERNLMLLNCFLAEQV